MICHLCAYLIFSKILTVSHNIKIPTKLFRNIGIFWSHTKNSSYKIKDATKQGGGFFSYPQIPDKIIIKSIPVNQRFTIKTIPVKEKLKAIWHHPGFISGRNKVRYHISGNIGKVVLGHFNHIKPCAFFHHAGPAYNTI